MNQSKKDMLLAGWDQAMDKEGWFPPLGAALEGVTAEQALWKPQPSGANSIWGIVNHLIFCKNCMLNNLSGRENQYPATNDATFEPSGSTEAEWQAAKGELKRLHAAVRERLAAMDDLELDHPSPAAPAGGQAFNQIMHDAYHTGQILMLRKQQGSWPASRGFGE